MWQQSRTPAENSLGSILTKSEHQNSTVEAVADSSAGDCNLVKPEIDFQLHDLFYLTVQYVPVRGEPHLLYQKYLKVKKAKPEKQVPEEVILPVDRLLTTIDMKIYRSSNRELVGSLSRCIELPNALPNLRLPGLTRSVETAGASTIFSLGNIMTERLVQEANAKVAGIPGFHSIFFGVYRVCPGNKFHLVSRRIQPISNSEVSDFFAGGVITTDYRTEAWLEPGNRLHLEFCAPPIGKRKESLAMHFYK